MNGFEPAGRAMLGRYAEYEAKLLFDLEAQWEKGGNENAVRIGWRGPGTKRSFFNALLLIEKYFKLLVAYAEFGPAEVQQQCDIHYFRKRLEENIPKSIDRFKKSKEDMV
jgi:hypothetical protein